MVSAHDALISLNSVPPFGQNVILQNVSTNETQEAIFVFVSKTAAKGGQFAVGIEFTKPNAPFWRVSFPPEDWSPSHPDAKDQR